MIRTLSHYIEKIMMSSRYGSKSLNIFLKPELLFSNFLEPLIKSKDPDPGVQLITNPSHPNPQQYSFFFVPIYFWEG